MIGQFSTPVLLDGRLNHMWSTVSMIFSLVSVSYKWGAPKSWPHHLLWCVLNPYWVVTASGGSHEWCNVLELFTNMKNYYGNCVHRSKSFIWKLFLIDNKKDKLMINKSNFTWLGKIKDMPSPYIFSMIVVKFKK